MRRFCAERLSAFQIPARVRLTEGGMHSARFKRVRRSDAAAVPPSER
jgi:hypothetical protein